MFTKILVWKCCCKNSFNMLMPSKSSPIITISSTYAKNLYSGSVYMCIIEWYAWQWWKPKSNSIFKKFPNYGLRDYLRPHIDQNWKTNHRDTILHPPPILHKTHPFHWVKQRVPVHMIISLLYIKLAPHLEFYSSIELFMKGSWRMCIFSLTLSIPNCRGRGDRMI